MHSLLKAYKMSGEPLGSEATTNQIAEWAGDTILNGNWTVDMRATTLLKIAMDALYDIENDIKIAYAASERAMEAIKEIDRVRGLPYE